MHKKEKPLSIQSLALEFIEKKDNKSFSLLIDRLKPGLLLFAKKYIRDRDICQEVVAQTFISVWEKIDQYDSKYNFSTWVYAIAKNEAFGQLRAGKRNVSHDQLVDNHSKILKIYSPEVNMDLECMSPSGDDLTIHLYDLTLREICSLDEPYRTVMYEREINKKQLQDIAEDLDWNLNTVKTRLRKARQEIADSLIKKYPELIEAYNEN